MIEEIKRIISNEVGASAPTALRYAVVESVSPLSVRLSPSLVISAPALSVSGLNIDGEGSLMLGIGDRVAVIRSQGGQDYFLISKVVQI